MKNISYLIGLSTLCLNLCNEVPRNFQIRIKSPSIVKHHFTSSLEQLAADQAGTNNREPMQEQPHQLPSNGCYSKVVKRVKDDLARIVKKYPNYESDSVLFNCLDVSEELKTELGEGYNVKLVTTSTPYIQNGGWLAHAYLEIPTDSHPIIIDPTYRQFLLGPAIYRDEAAMNAAKRKMDALPRIFVGNFDEMQCLFRSNNDILSDHVVYNTKRIDKTDTITGQHTDKVVATLYGSSR